MSLFRKSKAPNQSKEKPDLEKLQAEGNLIRLTEALEFPDGDVRAGAAQALGEIGDVRALDELLPKLKDGDPVVRLSAAEAIGEIIKKKLAPHIIHPVSQLDMSAWETQKALKERLRNSALPLLRTFAEKENNKYAREKAKAILSKVEDYF